MFAPGEEKRMPVIIKRADYDRWLNATPEEARALCMAYPDQDMHGEPAPRIQRAANRDADAPTEPPSGTLF